MFVTKHTKTNDGKKEAYMVGEKEEQKLYGEGALLGVKSGHQKTKSSDTW